VLLRRPVFKLEGLAAVKENNLVGLHNDCFLTSNTSTNIDLYTFSGDFNAYSLGVGNTPQELWESTRALSSSIPMGGETCTANPNRFACGTAVQEMKALHYDYVNSAFAPNAIKTWKSGSCYHEIAKRLGYRFHLRELKTHITGKEINVELQIQNTGWGKLMMAYQLQLGLSGAQWYGVGSDLQLLSKSASALNSVLAGQQSTFKFTFMAPTAHGTYELQVMLADPHSANALYAIQLATKNQIGGELWDGRLGVHQLGIKYSIGDTITVTTSPSPPPSPALISDQWVEIS